MSSDELPVPASDSTHLTIHPRTMASGKRTVQAGIAEIDTINHTYVYVPKRCVGRHRSPLVVYLHGSGGKKGHRGPGAAESPDWQRLADSLGFILVAPQAQGSTWDFDLSGGPKSQDMHLLDATLHHVLRDYAIDPNRIALTGGSDGATYGLMLGSMNGDVFKRIMAFSPGVGKGDLEALPSRGTPMVLLAHGANDQILHFEDRDTVMKWLRSRGDSVVYIEYAGGHATPTDILDKAFVWLNNSWK